MQMYVSAMIYYHGVMNSIQLPCVPSVIDTVDEGVRTYDDGEQV